MGRIPVHVCCAITGHRNSAAHCHNLVRRDSDLIQVSRVIIHHIGDMIVWETEEKSWDWFECNDDSQTQPRLINKSSKGPRTCPSDNILRNALGRSHRECSASDDFSPPLGLNRKPSVWCFIWVWGDAYPPSRNIARSLKESRMWVGT